MLAKKLNQEHEAAVLKKALLRTIDLLGINRAQLESILGISPATLSRLIKNSNQLLDPKSKEGEIALTVVRIFRSLDSLFGGNSEQAKLWIHSYNNHLGNNPIQLLSSLRGLFEVAQYLDAMRGKV